MSAGATITRDDAELQPLTFNHDDNYVDWITEEADAAIIIRVFYSPNVQHILKGIRDPHMVRNRL